MGRFWNKWKYVFILFTVLFALVWLYTFFNGGNAETTLVQFLRTDGLKATIIVVVVSIFALVFKRLFKVKIHHG